MLLNFTVENWASYRDETNLNLISSLERRHMETLARVPGFRSKKVLPVAAIYGGNASGKTNLFRALGILRHMVIADPGVDGIVPVVPFMLGEGADKPVVFDIAFMANATAYRLVVEARYGGIDYESLEIVSEKGAKIVYERTAETSEAAYRFAPKFFDDLDHLSYAAKSTRANRLFLGSAVAQNITELDEAYNWFAGTLELVEVQSQAWNFATCAIKKEGFLEYASEVLSLLDTGIARLSSEQVGIDSLPPDNALHNSIAKLGPDDTIVSVTMNPAGDYDFDMLTVRKEGDRPVVERLLTVHVGPNGEEHTFPLSMESSGTQRLMGLLPMLFDLSGEGGEPGAKVYVVDELDRCLHTMLTKKLISDFLATCGPETRKQLLFTTHDLLLMDQSLMRRDELFISERGTDGCSRLIGLSEYKDIRFDKDLVRSYLDGRFGGIPMLGQAAARG